MKKLFFPLFIMLGLFCHAQNDNYYNPIRHGGYFLQDFNARYAGFGNVGVVSPEMYQGTSISENPSLLTQKEKYFNAQLTYWDYLLSEHSFFFGLNLFYSPDTLNSFAVGMNYWTHGEITLTNVYGVSSGIVKPYDIVFNINYARKLNQYWSAGIGTRLFKSSFGDDNISNINLRTITSLCLNLGSNYNRKFRLSRKLFLDLQWGISINNIGSKIPHVIGETTDFLPTKLLTGILVGPEILIKKKYRLKFDLAYQAAKYLVPSYPVFDNDGEILLGTDPSEVTSLQALYQSFYDAPYGFREELSEIMHHFGAELSFNYNNLFYFALRGGYSSIHDWKGGDKVFASGIGIGLAGFMFNIYETYAQRAVYSQGKTYTLSYQTSLTELFDKSHKD